MRDGRPGFRKSSIRATSIRVTNSPSSPRSASLLAGCSSALMSIGAPPGSLPGIPKEAQRQPQPPAQGSREHQRILAAYNGAYDDAKLEGLLNQTVAKLVAASERPE